MPPALNLCSKESIVYYVISVADRPLKSKFAEVDLMASATNQRGVKLANTPLLKPFFPPAALAIRFTRLAHEYRFDTIAATPAERR
jgi:hypothetical protein